MDCFTAAMILQKGLDDKNARQVLVGMEALERMPKKYSSMVDRGLIRRSKKFLRREGYKVDVD